MSSNDVVEMSAMKPEGGVISFAPGEVYLDTSDGTFHRHDGTCHNHTNDWIASNVFDGGTSFGDEQYGDDLSVRYTRTAPDGTLLTVDYTVAVMAAQPVEEDSDTRPTAYWVDERTDYSQGTQDNPDSLYADVEYGQGSYRSYTTPEEAEVEAVRMMLCMSSDYIDWDGM